MVAPLVQLTDLRTARPVFVQPSAVANLQDIPTALGAPGTFVTLLESDGEIPVPELLAVTGTAAANAALLGGVLFTKLGGGSVFVVPSSVALLREIPTDLGGPGTYIEQIRPQGDFPVPALLAVTGTPAAAAAALAAAPGTLIVVEIDATAARALAPGDNGKTIVFTNAGGCNVTVPSTLPIGFSCVLVQDAVGAVTLVAGAGVTFRAPVSIVAPYTTAEEGGTIGITMIRAGQALVYGLAA